ncbi:MAG: hypothetical protein K2Y42_00285 [Hyphomicrobium sp.]|jgi:hypothetical protein|uniref:hypothetical protein n=1 Tax=Hyphomicrobium sp. TaxID=82 RepID=UPI0025B8B6F8|nr:hypothetical protein [Hyphomicrobium sp.]MBX9861161.1 hypothetical protein [Hyphomicrobium sp.]
MSTRLQGHVLFGKFEKNDSFQWTDPLTGTPKPINSFKVLVAHSDGTVTRESITLPPNYRIPNLESGEMYGFPVTVRLNKKRQQVSWDARQDLMPFPAPEMG